MRTSTRIAGLALLLAGLAPAAFAGADVKINSDAAGDVQNEIRMTRNATDANNFVVAYNDDAGALSSPLGVSFSLDGGQTWSDRQLGIPTHPVIGSPDDMTSLAFIFDPFIDSDSTGNVYAGYIATDGSGGGPPSGLYIELSQDQGQSWSGPTNISFDARSTFVPPGAYRFNDRPDMTVDTSDNVYVVWIKDVGVGLPTSDIYFAKSPPPGPPSPGNPTGLDFTGLVPNSVAPQTVNDLPNGIDEANVPDVVVASDGTVYVAWIDVDVTNPLPKPAQLMIDRSMDGGVSFGPDTLVLAISGLANHLSTTAGAGTFDDARSGSYPAIAVDPGNPMTLHMVYAADPAGADEADIFFITSLDGGFTWSAPLVVNDDAATNDQFHPMIATRSDGTINVAWYDKRLAANDDSWDVYFADSVDGGASFSPNVRITDQSFATPVNLPGTEPWLGEYLGLVVDSTSAFFAFTSGIGDSRGDVYFDSALPSLGLVKAGALDVGGNGVADPGDPIHYTFTLTNAGSVTLTNVAVSDPMVPAITCPSGIPIPALAIGAMEICTGSYTLTQVDIDAGQKDNTATADSDQTPPVVDSDTVAIAAAPALTLAKTGVPDLGADGFADPGDRIDYSFAVTNTGNVTLTDVAVTDPMVPSITCPGGNPMPSLAVGASETCTATYTLTQADVDAGQKDNTATVNSPAVGGVVSANDSDSQLLPQAPPPPLGDIPALSPWGLGILVASLALGALALLRRKDS